MVVAVMFTRLIPPFQSPDENVHLLRAAMIANGQFMLQRSNHNVRDSGPVDPNFVAFSEAAAMLPPIGVHPTGSALREFMKQVDRAHWSGDVVTVNAAGTGYYTPIIYVPHAIGLWLAQKLDLSMLRSYELTRAVVITVALGIALYACSIWQPNALVLMLLLTPMSLFQWFSPTIDGLSNALVLLLLALWLSVARDERPTSRFSDELLLYVVVFVLCTTRTHLLPILLIPLTLLAHRFSWPRLLGFLALTASVLGWQIFAASNSGQHFLNRQHSTAEIILLYLQNPGEFFSTLIRTLEKPELIEFYYKSFIGLLGWINVPLTQNKAQDLYYLLLAGLLITLWIGKPWQRLGFRLIGIVIAICSLLLAFFALAVSYNDYPTPHIVGIQGRYMIPVAVILAFALGPLDAARRQYSKLELAALIVFIPYSLNATSKLLLKYYDTAPIEAVLG